MTATGKLKGFGEEGHGWPNKMDYKEVHAMKDLTKAQVETLVEMALLYDCHETPMDQEHLGHFAPKVEINNIDEESLIRLAIAATIIHMSRFSAEDIELLFLRQEDLC